MLRALAAERDHTQASETLRCARRLISPLAGPIGRLSEVPRASEEPSVTCVAAVGAVPVAGPGHTGPSALDAGGVGLGWPQAAARAVGEALERYAARRLDPARLRVASWQEVDGPATESYELFSAAQWSAGLPYIRLADDTVLEWVHGWDLATGRPVSVPAKRVCLAPPTGRWLADIGPTTSTGLACGTNRDAVLLAGLLETIERDAFALTWWRQLPTTPLRLPDHGPLAQLARERFWHSGLSFVFRLLPTDTDVPVVLAMVLDPGADRGVAAVGASAHLDPAAALLKAWLEAIQTRAWLRQMGGGVGFDPGPGFENVRRFPDHVRLFGQPRSLAHLDFLVHTPRSPAGLDELPDMSHNPAVDLAWCLERLARCDLRAVAVDLTTPELSACGFVAMKVLVPGMADIAPSHAHRFLGSPRLWDVPARLGCDPGCDLNPYPHPFP